jgi:hypothetical protein
MDATTDLRDARLDTHTLLADVVWNGVPLTRLNWQDVTRLGDEQVARQPKDNDRKRKTKATRLQEYCDAVRANRQVATVLRSQGLNEPADRFAYRAQLCQRQVLWRQRNVGGYLFSLFLDALTGYGYRLWHIIVVYMVVVIGFAVLSVAGDILSARQMTMQEAQDAIVASLQAFHAHTFGNIFNPRGAVTFVEALCGLVIESTFIAMLVSRLRAGSGG